MYYRYTPKQRADIGRYACLHGVTATARYYSRKLNEQLAETTVRSIRDAYKEEIKLKRKDQGEESTEICTLPLKKRGRQVLLGKDLDQKVQLYLHKVREGGGVVSARIAMAAARGILLSCDSDRAKLVEFGGHIHLNRHWAYSLFKRMKFVKLLLLRASIQLLILQS